MTRLTLSSAMGVAWVLLGCGEKPPAAHAPPPTTVLTEQGALRAPCMGASPYEPLPATTLSVQLPAAPTLPQRETRIGEAYTVWGASYFLRHPAHMHEVLDKDLSIEGVVIGSNLEDAPLCAVHPTGIADPDDCAAPLPTFWIADTVDAERSDAIAVMGWASNFAQIYDALLEFEAGNDTVIDQFWGIAMPNPLPSRGARVRVTGTYAHRFTKSTFGSVEDPVMGIFTYESVTTLEPAPDKASLPGMKSKRR